MTAVNWIVQHTKHCDNPMNHHLPTHLLRVSYKMNHDPTAAQPPSAG